MKKIFKQIIIFSFFLICSSYAYADASNPRIGYVGPVFGKWGKELEILPQYSLIITGCDSKGKEISYIKSKNPKSIILCYVSVTVLMLKDKRMRSELWLHMPNTSQPIPLWSGNIPNQTLSEVNEIIIKEARDTIESRPQADGIFLDTFIEGRIIRGVLKGLKGTADADGDGRADEPKNFDEAWNSGLIQIVKNIRAIKPEMIIVGNGTPDIAYDLLNGAEFEDKLNYLADYGTKGLDTNITADKLLNSYQKWESAPTKPHVILFADTPDVGVIKNPQQMKRYYRCFALMGEGYTALKSKGKILEEDWFPNWNINLGAPLEPVQKLEGYWIRKFEHGTVYVNPYSKPVTLKYKDLEFLLSAYDGKIILEEILF